MIVYLSDLWRVRCRPSNGACGNQWGGGWNETRRQHNASDNSGGGMIWLKLDLFRNTSATNGSKDGPGPRASAALSHHVSERGTRRLLLFGLVVERHVRDVARPRRALVVRRRWFTLCGRRLLWRFGRRRRKRHGRRL